MDEASKIVHDFESASNVEESKKDTNSMNGNKAPVVLFIILAVLGIATGFLLSKTAGSTVQIAGPDGKVSTATVEKGQIFGSADEKTFKDNTEGILKEGGIDGEGAFHLERPGGDSQNVYLTSSVIDLSGFVGKKVKVWGQTNASDKAGWLMDVGRLQVL